MPKIRQKKTCAVNDLSHLHIDCKGSQCAIFKILGPAIACYKMHFLVKCVIVALEELEVHILIV